ncbi:hypothetical protein MYX75_08465, partial [Acidobacteria bacterium AH-259-A15]|nr:hypothetical protein [Acidobacteria bacterium AH-259-A15]
LCIVLLLTVTTQAQTVWDVSRKSRDIQIDGFIEDWAGVPKTRLNLSAPSVRGNGNFGGDDLDLALQALWDQQNLYVAVQWEDDTWDIKRIGRHEAVWVSPERRRRDRMLFFDNLKFHIREADYDYTLWISPRVSGEGPFMWHRLLKGLKGMETATSAPLVTARFHEGKATMEIMFLWRELRIKPKDQKIIPLTLIVADSDLPGRFLEAKHKHLKWLEWHGRLQLLSPGK